MLKKLKIDDSLQNAIIKLSEEMPLQVSIDGVECTKWSEVETNAGIEFSTDVFGKVLTSANYTYLNKVFVNSNPLDPNVDTTKLSQMSDQLSQFGLKILNNEVLTSGNFLFVDFDGTKTIGTWNDMQLALGRPIDTTLLAKTIDKTRINILNKRGEKGKIFFIYSVGSDHLLTVGNDDVKYGFVSGSFGTLDSGIIPGMGTISELYSEITNSIVCFKGETKLGSSDNVLVTVDGVSAILNWDETYSGYKNMDTSLTSKLVESVGDVLTFSLSVD